MGLKRSPNQIPEPLWIFFQPLTMTFPATQIQSGKWDVNLDGVRAVLHQQAPASKGVLFLVGCWTLAGN